MIQRRQFIGSVAATCLIATMPRSVRAAGLDWSCDVVQIPSSSAKKRAPVVTGVCLSPNQLQVAIVGDDHLVNIFDRSAATFAPPLAAHRDWIRAVAFSPDGAQLATAGNDRMLFLWKTQTWEQPLLLAQHSQAIVSLAFSPDNQLLATVGFCKKLYLYELNGSREVSHLECPCEDMRSVAFSLDGRFIAAAGRSGVIRVWETVDRKLAAEYSAHRQRIRSLQYNSVGQLLSCGDDHIVRLSDPLNMTTIAELPQQPAKLFAVTLLDDNLCATSGSDNAITIWRFESKDAIGQLKGHTGTVSALSAGPNLLVSGSYDTQIRIWHRQQDVNLVQPRQTSIDPNWNSRIK